MLSLESILYSGVVYLMSPFPLFLTTYLKPVSFEIDLGFSAPNNMHKINANDKILILILKSL
jgi:hypothetical protein